MTLLLQSPIQKSELIAVFFLRARIIQRALDLDAGGLAARLAWRLGDFVTNSRE